MNDELESTGFLPLVCSSCFQDEGLRLMTSFLGVEVSEPCPNCGLLTGKKLDRNRLREAMHAFFSIGTITRHAYGGCPVIVCNEHHPTDVKLSSWSGIDLQLLTEKSGLNVFHYGPRLWMLGEVDPLRDLISEEHRSSVIERLITEYPVRTLGIDEHLYRIRINPDNPDSFEDFDSPPDKFCGSGRLDFDDFPVLYGSQDIEVCIHECRTTVDDETFVATLAPARDLKLLDLSHLLKEEHVTEFESLDMAVHMLFLAKKHSYPISRVIAKYLKQQGFDGVIYPSYFSLRRTGSIPFETIFGISVRRFPDLKSYASRQMVANLALFGRPIREGLLRGKSINRVLINKASYTLSFGPVGYEYTGADD